MSQVPGVLPKAQLLNVSSRTRAIRVLFSLKSFELYRAPARGAKDVDSHSLTM